MAIGRVRVVVIDGLIMGAVNVLFVRVSVVSLPTSVSVAIGRVRVVDIDGLIMGAVNVLFVNVCVESFKTTLADNALSAMLLGGNTSDPDVSVKTSAPPIRIIIDCPAAPSMTKFPVEVVYMSPCMVLSALYTKIFFPVSMITFVIKWASLYMVVVESVMTT